MDSLTQMQQKMQQQIQQQMQQMQQAMQQQMQQAMQEMQQSVQQQMLTLQHSLVVPQQEQLSPPPQVQPPPLVMLARGATQPALLLGPTPAFPPHDAAPGPTLPAHNAPDRKSPPLGATPSGAPRPGGTAAVVAAATPRPDFMPREDPRDPLHDASLVAVPGALQGAQGLSASADDIVSARGARTGTGA